MHPKYFNLPYSSSLDRYRFVWNDEDKDETVVWYSPYTKPSFADYFELEHGKKWVRRESQKAPSVPSVQETDLLSLL